MKLEVVKRERPGGETSSPASRAFALLIGSALLVGGYPSMAQTGFETPQTFRASKILPPELLVGPDHRIAERVVNDGFMNTYTINSRFGTFTANSAEELRIRVGEVNAIARMDDWANSEHLPIPVPQLVTGSDTGLRQGVLHTMIGGHNDGISDNSAGVSGNLSG